MRILYVEDTLLNLCLIERIARMGSHEVINYAYAERALQNFDVDRPDLILVDLRLEGDMTGIDFIERIRARECTKPIIVITAHSDDETRERCMAAGATEFYAKPLLVRDMVRMIQEHEVKRAPTVPPVSADEATQPSPPPLPIRAAEITRPAKPAGLARAIEPKPSAIGDARPGGASVAPTDKTSEAQADDKPAAASCGKS